MAESGKHFTFAVESRVVKRGTLKKNWELTREAFQGLLARLDPDPLRAGQQYEHIRRSLVTFFECRGSRSAEDHADETINRVARRLAEGKEMYVANPASYFYGVARNILKEEWEKAKQMPAELDTLPAIKHLSDDASRVLERELERRRGDRRLECLEHCLQKLTNSDRDLILEYYRGDTNVKIENRKTLSERLGVGLNALRIRALRIRERLESCVKDCEKESELSESF